MIIVILINFQESNFRCVRRNRGNEDGSYDWGPLQFNDKYFPQFKEYVLKGDWDSYYREGFKYILYKKDRDLREWFLNHHSRTREYREKYYNNFLRRTRGKYKDLRLLLEVSDGKYQRSI